MPLTTQTTTHSLLHLTKHLHRLHPHPTLLTLHHHLHHLSLLLPRPTRAARTLTLPHLHHTLLHLPSTYATILSVGFTSSLLSQLSKSACALEVVVSMMHGAEGRLDVLEQLLGMSEGGGSDGVPVPVWLVDVETTVFEAGELEGVIRRWEGRSVEGDGLAVNWQRNAWRGVRRCSEETQPDDRVLHRKKRTKRVLWFMRFLSLSVFMQVCRKAMEHAFSQWSGGLLQMATGGMLPLPVEWGLLVILWKEGCRALGQPRRRVGAII